MDMDMDKQEIILVAAAAYVAAMVISFLKKAIASSYGAYTGGNLHDEGSSTSLVTLQTHIKDATLPPGSMGLPFLGESLSFKSQRQKFWISRQQQYGDVYKTHLFGYPSIVVAGPQAARFVMVDQACSFRQRGLPLVEMMLGTNFFGYQHEKIHANLKKIFYGPLLPEALERSIPMVEAIAIDILKDWDGKTINTLEEAKKYVFKVAMEFVVGATPEHEKAELTSVCEHLIRGVSSLRNYAPGTCYYKAIKESRKKACALLDKIMSVRRVSNDELISGLRFSLSSSNDMLGLMMRLEDENGIQMSDEEIHDNVLTILHAAYDSSASVLCWTIKVLTEHPNLLASIKEEHEMIHAEKGSDENIKWYDVKEQMQLSLKVIKETLRIANVVEFSYREAIEDVSYSGMVFPKGWRVIIAHVAYHMNSTYFPCPKEFDPSRFRVQPKLFSFTPFGSGSYGCIGRELFHLQILVFLHHLVLRYSWEHCGSEDGSEFVPTHVPKGGYPIHVKERGNDEHSRRVEGINKTQKTKIM